MRISDWSSDVCSSDLEASRQGLEVRGYRPSERDLQELDRVRRDASRNSIAPAVTAPASREPERDRRQADEASRQTPSEQSRVKNRSAEHTYELQSLKRISYATFSLNKKLKSYTIATYHIN